MMAKEINNEKTDEANKEKQEPEKEKQEPELQKPPISPLEEARALNESIKAHNAELKLLLDRQERLAADARLEGKGFAGQNQKVKEPAPNEKAMEFFKGSEIEKALARHPQLE